MCINPAVDHVATYAWWRGFGPKGHGRITLRRHGPFLREEKALTGSKPPSEPALATIFSNVATAQLSIAAAPLSEGACPLFKVEPIDRPAGQVLGEPCRWFDTTVGVADYSRLECRSGDGLPLAVVESRRGSRQSYIAVSLSRGRTRPGDMMPPPGLLDWASWGWPQLAR
jgi:hypothetical protein